MVLRDFAWFWADFVELWVILVVLNGFGRFWVGYGLFWVVLGSSEVVLARFWGGSGMVLGWF
jgi:hypothetical protein